VLDAGIDAEFVIAGQGESEFNLRRRAERLRIADRTTFAGRNVIGALPAGPRRLLPDLALPHRGPPQPGCTKSPA
jgi:hypothetical protein